MGKLKKEQRRREAEEAAQHQAEQSSQDNVGTGGGDFEPHPNIDPTDPQIPDRNRFDQFPVPTEEDFDRMPRHIEAIGDNPFIRVIDENGKVSTGVLTDYQEDSELRDKDTNQLIPGSGTFVAAVFAGKDQFVHVHDEISGRTVRLMKVYYMDGLRPATTDYRVGQDAVRPPKVFIKLGEDSTILFRIAAEWRRARKG